MWTIEQHVGRLVELRISSPVLLPELGTFGSKLATLMSALHQRGLRSIGCVDLRHANVFAPEVSEGFIGIMQRDNALLDRSAFLIGSSAVFSMQVDRMIKQSNHPTRRTFRDSEPLIAWLGEVLSPAECDRLRSFLSPR